MPPSRSTICSHCTSSAFSRKPERRGEMKISHLFVPRRHPVLLRATSAMLARSIQCYLLCLVRVFQQLHRNVLSNALVLMTEELGLTISEKGTLLAMIPLGYILTQVPGGALADRIGAKNVMLYALTLSSLCCLTLPVVHLNGGMYGLYGILVLMGAVQGPMFPTSSVYLARWMPKAKPGEPDEKAWGTSMLDVGISIGTLFIIPVVKFLVEAVGWRHTYHIVGLVSLGYCALFQIFAASSPSECSYISKAELEQLKNNIPAKKDAAAEAPTPAPTHDIAKQKAALLAAKEVGALSKSLYSKAIDELMLPAKKSSGLCYQIVGMPFHVATSPGLWAVFGAQMALAFNFGAYYQTNWSSVYYNDVLDVVPKDSAYHLMMPNITNLIAKSLTPTINAFLAKRGYSLLKCRKLFTCSGFMLAAAALLPLRFIVGPNKVILSTVCFSIANAMLGLSPCGGFKNNYLEITEENVGIIAGYGNTLGTVASFVQPKIVDYILSTTGSWALVLATVCAVNTAASINYALHATVDPFEKFKRKAEEKDDDDDKKKKED